MISRTRRLTLWRLPPMLSIHNTNTRMDQQKVPMVKHHIQESSTVLILRIIFCLFAADIAYIIVTTALLGASISGIATDGISYVPLIIFLTFIKFILQSIFVAAITLITLSRHYYITEQQLIVHKGVLTREEKVFDLQQIKSVRRHQSFLGKLAGYGDLTISIAESGFKEDVKIRNIRTPKRYEEVFVECMKHTWVEAMVPTQSKNPTEPGK